MVTLASSEIWDLLNSIPDPEVPAISIVELGVVRDVRITDSNVEVDITPTYSELPCIKEYGGANKSKTFIGWFNSKH